MTGQVYVSLDIIIPFCIADAVVNMAELENLNMLVFSQKWIEIEMDQSEISLSFFLMFFLKSQSNSVSVFQFEIHLSNTHQFSKYDYK